MSNQYNSSMRFTLAAVLLVSTASAGIIEDVRAAVAQKDFAGADLQVQTYRKAHGATAELAAAIGWEARGALAAKNLDQAEAYADQARKMTLPNLGPRVDREQWLYAIGTAIEVRAQVLAARGETGEAVDFLNQELKTFTGTTQQERIQKNINLLSLEGKPAPALESAIWFGPKAPPSIASLRGKAVLLFFWAHWCPDCKADVPIIAGLMKKYGPQGLTLIGPTRYYGYVANGTDAPPEIEKPYIEQVRRQYYAPLIDMPAPLSNANFVRYGASSTPTLALVNRKGIISWYHPGAATEKELAVQIEKALR
ncbi:MAG TPA: TlpA disulfide reductase family protein [Terracidiphilus sp.]